MTANAFKHGQSYTGTYRSWYHMIQRCNNPNATRYSYYGGRGITFDPAWRDFRNFYADMGDRPAGTTLDRIDNDGNYNKSNCRWATGIEQHNNQRHCSTCTCLEKE